MYLRVVEVAHHSHGLDEILCGASIGSSLRGFYIQDSSSGHICDVLQNWGVLSHCKMCILLLPKCCQINLSLGIIRVYRY
jgi:hypothetical protein